MNLPAGVALTIAEVLLATVSVYAIRTLYVHRAGLTAAGAFVGISTIGVGLSLVVIYCMIDLFALQVAPAVFTDSQAAAVSDAGYVRFGWLSLFGGVGLVGLGIALSASGFAIYERAERERHRLAEQSLRANEERLQDVIDVASDWFWEMGPDLRFTYFSDGYFDEIGTRVSDRIGTHRRDRSAGTGIPGEDERWVAHQRDLDARRPFRDFEYAVRSPDGKIKHVSVSGKPIFDESGRFLGYRGSRRDVTERKRAELALIESETRLRAIVDSAPFVIYLKDLEGRYMLVNQRFKDIMKRTEEELIGHRSHDIFAPDVADRLIAGDREAIAGRKPHSFELDIHSNPTGRRMVIKFPVIDANGAVVAVGGIAVDVTEQAQLREQLTQAQKMEAVGQLTGGIAHDFNNLLAIILGNLELLSERSEGDGVAQDLAARAIAGAERGAELTHRLLAFSRKQALVPKVIDPRAQVVGMVDLLRRTLGETIEIEIMGAAELWPCLVDPAQLESAILNLAINARDAMPNGGKLAIETENATLDHAYTATQADVEPGQYVVIAVSDTGIGIPAEAIAHVFEPFYSTKSVGSGTGLGLSMVFGFVKQSGGHLTIYSEVGVGTTVKIYLPRSLGSAQAVPAADAEAAPRARDETVLVVEDDPDVRDLTVLILTELGYRVLAAKDGPSALNIADGPSEIDLLFTDVVLSGGMNGPTLAAEIVRRRPGIAVLFTSGYTENAIVHQGRLDEGVELINKPFRKRDLAQRVRSILDRAGT